MTVKEYLNKLGIDTESSCINLAFVTLVRYDDGQNYSRITSMRTIWEWFEDNSTILDSYVLNTKQPVVSWLSGANWNPSILNDRNMCLLVVSKEQLLKMYSEKQAMETLKYIDHKIEESLKKNPFLES